MIMLLECVIKSQITTYKLILKLTQYGTEYDGGYADTLYVR